MDNNRSDLSELLMRLEWLLRRRHIQHHRGRSPVAAANQGQGRVLALLKLKPELSQKELSTILDIRSQSLGELLAKLERQGYITRTPSTEDRRSMNIQLTEAGKAASEQQEAGPDFDTLFQCLNAEEQQNFADYLERIIQSLEAELGPDGPWARHGFGPPPGDPGFGRHGHMRGFDDHGFGPGRDSGTRRGFGPGPGFGRERH